MDKDPKGRGSDPLSFGDLNLNDIVILYGWGHRWGGIWREPKGKGDGSRRDGILLFDFLQVEILFCLNEEEEDLKKDGVENVGWELLQVVVEGVGVKQVEDQSRQEGEGGAKGQAKHSREIVWAHSEMLELGKGDVMEKLNEELAGNVLLIREAFFDSNKNEGGDNSEDIEGMDAECQK